MGSYVAWNWQTNPVYDSDSVRIDSRVAPIVHCEFKSPRDVTDDEIQMFLDVADQHILNGDPYLALVGLRPATGIVSARHRKMFADWLVEREKELQQENVCTVVVIPESIFRAVLRVVYRFRVPPLRTVTVPSMQAALDAARTELVRIGHELTPELTSFLDSLEVAESLSG